MKLLLESWRQYLNEAYVKHAGIIKVVPDDALKQVALGLYAANKEQIEAEGGKPLPDEKLHVTLFHHKIRPEGVSGGQWKKLLKDLPSYEGQLALKNEVEKMEKGGSTSWLAYVDEGTQAGLLEYIIGVFRERGLSDEIIEDLLDKEAPLLGTAKGGRRLFHVSLGNIPSDPNAEFANPMESVA